MQVWCWKCELCGHTWIGVGIAAPAQCAKCKKRNWHTISHTLATPSEVNLSSLRDVCAGNLHQSESDPVEDRTPQCCECGHQLTGKAIKGRGIVWACSDPGCAMYGREAR